MIGSGGGGENAVAGGGEVEFERRRAEGNFFELVGAHVEDEDVAAGAADAPNFGALGVFAKIGDGGTRVDFVDDAEGDEIDDEEVAVGSGDVGVEVEIGAKEGWAVFAEEDDEGERGENGEQEIDAKIFGVRHEQVKVYMRGTG